MDLIQVSASCVAEIAQASPSTRLRKLVPFKYNNRGEGAGRSAYYKLTVDTVRKFHRGDNERKHIRSAAEHLLGIEDNDSFPRNVRTRARLNTEALLAYENLYGNRKFSVLQNHRLSIAVGPVTITAQPDLWVEENGHIVLMKIGVGKDKSPH